MNAQITLGKKTFDVMLLGPRRGESRALRWRANPTKARRARAGPTFVCTQGAHMCKFRLSSVSDVYFDIDMHENSPLGLNSMRHEMDMEMVNFEQWRFASPAEIKVHAH